MAKPKRVKIQRPADAASNTAFTQVSQTETEARFPYRKIRIALDPSDLADDSAYNISQNAVSGAIIYSVERQYEKYKWSAKWSDGCWFMVSCRSPQKLQKAYLKSGHAARWFEDHRVFLAFGEAELKRKKKAKCV